jgi:hypothetical protein
MRPVMTLAAKLDDLGNPAWIGVTVVSFLIWWPLGLVALGYLIGSGRMAHWMGCTGRHWQPRNSGDPSGWWSRRSPSSGNWAFDAYRAETLRRLEEEEREFKAFLDRLRRAKDKAEFDQFMAERGRPAQNPPQQQES